MMQGTFSNPVIKLFSEPFTTRAKLTLMSKSTVYSFSVSLQEIIRGSASKAHGAQLLDKLNATIESKENRMRLLCGMMTLLVRDEYAVVGMVLEQLVSQEGKLVADLVLGDEMEYFEVHHPPNNVWIQREGGYQFKIGGSSEPDHNPQISK